MDIEYHFSLEDGTSERFSLEFDSATFELLNPPGGPFPPWTDLQYKQCPNCPLSVDEHPRCPLAVRIAPLVGRFDTIISFEEVQLEVRMEERIVSQNTSAQRAASSLMGLLIATSGCPHAALFRPMARFHLPLSSMEETTYRVVSMYFLSRYFLGKRDPEVPLTLDGLWQVYENLNIVNNAVAQRLRSASTADSSINALVRLDLFAITIPVLIEPSFAELERLFEPWIRLNQPAGGTE